jgi:hypothetical protein
MKNQHITSLNFEGYKTEILIVESDYVKVTFSPLLEEGRFTLKIPKIHELDDEALTLIATYANMAFNHYKGTEIFGKNTYRTGGQRLKDIKKFLEKHNAI